MVHLRLSECQDIRDFMVLDDPNQEEPILDRPWFTFFLSDHPRMLSEIDLLIGKGKLVRIDSSPVPTFRIVEDFAAYLLKGWPKVRWPYFNEEWIRTLL